MSAPASSPASAASHPSRLVTARAPVRLDFGGGWTDVPPYCDEQGGVVCNVAVARYAVCRLDEAGGHDAEPLSPLAAGALHRLTSEGARPRLRLGSDFPVGAGLGGSSAAGVATIAALARWRGRELARAELAEMSRAVETEELGIAGGRQDHYAAAFGGALELEFGAGADVAVRPILLDDATRDALERRCLVVYTGESRISGRTITAVLDAYRAREPRVTGALARMRELAQGMAHALRAGAVDDLGGLVGEHWAHQRGLDPAIPTPLIDAVIDAARRAGALGAKALGASGGGCVLAIAAEGREEPVREAMAALAEPFDVRVDTGGVHVTDDERAP